MGRVAQLGNQSYYAFANGGVIPATYFSDSGRAFSHPEYPLAIPFTELWLYLWLGEADHFLRKGDLSNFLCYRNIFGRCIGQAFYRKNMDWAAHGGLSVFCPTDYG